MTALIYGDRTPGKKRFPSGFLHHIEWPFSPPAQAVLATLHTLRALAITANHPPTRPPQSWVHWWLVCVAGYHTAHSHTNIPTLTHSPIPDPTISRITIRVVLSYLIYMRHDGFFIIELYFKLSFLC